MALTLDLVIILLLVLIRSPLPSEEATVNRDDSEVCRTAACQETAQLLLDAMDTSVDPCYDFFRYACGGWLKRHPIPEENRGYNVFQELGEQVLDTVAEMLNTAISENHAKPIIDALVLFKGCIDTGAKETQGLDPLKILLTSLGLGDWPVKNSEWSDAHYKWQTLLGVIKRTLDINAIFYIFVWADPFISSHYRISLDQAEFGLQSAHLENITSSEGTKEIVAAYKNYIISTAKLLNPNVEETVVTKNADEIIEFESALARISYPANMEENATADYEKFTVSQLQEFTKNTDFEWRDFLNNIFQDFRKVRDETEMVVFNKYFFAHAIKVTHETDPRIISNYLGWIVLKNLGEHTTKEFRDNAFLFQKVKEGRIAPKKLERVCSVRVSSLLPFAVGRIYVDKHFTEEQKLDVEKLVEDARAAFEVNLNHNEWMDDDTREKALEKLRSMAHFVGYPTWIKDDDELSQYYQSVHDVKQDEFFSSLLKVTGAITAMQLSKWDQPTNRTTEFDAKPTEVNAYYDPFVNTIMFPAGILNSPYYKYGRLPALNYGGIGSVIGHEISHGYDNDGSQYGKEGYKENWWSEATKDKFEKKIECMKNQYSEYVEPLTNMTLNGNSSLADNIADNGGLRNAFMAYQMQVLQAEENEIIKNQRLPGVSATPEQLFFLGYAVTNCGHQRKESMEYSVKYDLHAPYEFRVIVPVSNSRAFSEAFNCPVGSRMNPASKCHLW